MTAMRCAKLACLIGLACVVACSAGAPGPASYGSKVRFKRNVAVVFPDFELTHLGRRHVESPKFKPGFDVEDFRVSRGGESITVSWSSGTGDIGPSEFEFAGMRFGLELRHADQLGRLTEDEIVVVKR